MNKDNEYRANAAECERMARLIRDKTDKRTWCHNYFPTRVLAVFPSPLFPCHAFRIGRLDRHSGRSLLPRWCHSDAMDRQRCPFWRDA